MGAHAPAAPSHLQSAHEHRQNGESLAELAPTQSVSVDAQASFDPPNQPDSQKGPGPSAGRSRQEASASGTKHGDGAGTSSEQAQTSYAYRAEDEHRSQLVHALCSAIHAAHVPPETLWTIAWMLLQLVPSEQSRSAADEHAGI